MIYFFADDHFGMHPGLNIAQGMPPMLKQEIRFYENDWTMLESGDWLKDCNLLVLNMIGTTCGQPHPGKGAEAAVKAWCEKGGNMLLLHGSSAAFWHWDWWRSIVGMRWVRPEDPDGVAPSVHPHSPYTLRKCKTRHPLMERLAEISLPDDEIYTQLEQVQPITVFLDTFIETGSFPQCFEAMTPWGGKCLSFLPGHSPNVTSNPEILKTISTLIAYLMEK